MVSGGWGSSWGPWAGTLVVCTLDPEHQCTNSGSEVIGQAEPNSLQVLLGLIAKALKGPRSIRGTKHTNLLWTGSHCIYQSTLELWVVQVDLEPV